MNSKNLTFLLSFTILCSLPSQGYDRSEAVPDLTTEQAEALTKPAFKLNSRENEKRNTFIPPLVSYVLPGFDQWIEGQYGYAATYTGLGASGIAIQLSAKRHSQKFADLGSRDPEVRRSLLGGSLYILGGGLSSYHSFHTAISNQRNRFNYIDPRLEEEPLDLAMAPFHFSYLGRHTTWIPLGIIAGLGTAQFLTGTKWYGPTLGDIGMTSVMSFSAGVNEEASFRGFLMPWLRSGVETNWGSNLITSLIFAAAHISPDLPVPWPQFALGYYLGYLTQANNWTIGESIFVHTWWDVAAFLIDYAATQKMGNLMIGPLTMHF